MRVVKDICPDIELHASTQMSVGTLDGIRTLADLGFSRAVLPRELSKDEIKYLCENSRLSLKMFVPRGALYVRFRAMSLECVFRAAKRQPRSVRSVPAGFPFGGGKPERAGFELKGICRLSSTTPILSKNGIFIFQNRGAGNGNVPSMSQPQFQL